MTVIEGLRIRISSMPLPLSCREQPQRRCGRGSAVCGHCCRLQASHRHGQDITPRGWSGHACWGYRHSRKLWANGCQRSQPFHRRQLVLITCPQNKNKLICPSLPIARPRPQQRLAIAGVERLPRQAKASSRRSHPFHGKQLVLLQGLIKIKEQVLHV